MAIEARLKFQREIGEVFASVTLNVRSAFDGDQDTDERESEVDGVAVFLANGINDVLLQAREQHTEASKASGAGFEDEDEDDSAPFTGCGDPLCGCLS